MLMLGFEFR